MSLYAINLDPGFKPFALPEAATVKNIDYPSGCEPHLRLENCVPAATDIMFTARPRSMDGLFRVLLAVDAASRRWGGMRGMRRQLFMPYLPHARQDRTAVVGDAHSLYVVAEMLKQCEFSRVILFDPHSNVSSAVVTNSYAHEPTVFHRWVIESERQEEHLTNGWAVVYPDKGAKLRGYFSQNWTPQSVTANKERNPKDGSLKVEVKTDFPKGYTYIIVDDICDGGGTFIPIAKQLKEQGAGRVVLAVSHGLFTKGTAPLHQAGIDHIYTTNSFQSYMNYPGFTVWGDWSFINPLLS